MDQTGAFRQQRAYKLSQWVVNERIVAERNPRYWDNAHTVINKVTYLPITSEASDVNRYKAGEIDIVYTVPINQFAQLKKTLGSELTSLRSWRPITTNSIPPGRRSNDARVRKALNMALDKDIIAGKVLGQGQRPAWLISQPISAALSCRTRITPAGRWTSASPRRKSC